MFLTILVGGVLLWLILNLRRRVERLEQKIEPEKIKKKDQEPQPAQFFQKEKYKEKATSPKPAQPPKSTPSQAERLVEWLKRDWILKVGALLLLIGFGWLATYAFLNNWIGPQGRIALGIISGVIILSVGWWRIKKYLHQGGVFLVLGSTVVLITIFAAREFYGLFTPLSALSVMFLSTAFVALASVKYNSRALSLASLALAGAAPLFTNSPPPHNYTALFSYLFVVTLGTIWIVVLTRKRELTTAALILVAFYSLPHLFSPSATTASLLPFAYAFAALFFITNTLGILKLKEKKMRPDLITAAGNGLLLLSWIMTAVRKEWQSLTIAAWMIVFAVGAFIIFKITQKKKPFYLYSGIGIAMLAAATSAELSGATLTIAYTIEVAAITLLTYFFLRKVRPAQKVSLLLMCPILLSLASMNSRAWSRRIFHKDFFVLLILALTLIGLGIFFWRRCKEIKSKQSARFNVILLTTGTIYVYILLWLSLHAAMIPKDVATMICLVIYTVIGLTAYFYAAFQTNKALRFYGAGLLVFVVGRLLLHEIWTMELTGRIITFFLVGILFVSTAFLSRNKNKNKLKDLKNQQIT